MSSSKFEHWLWPDDFNNLSSTARGFREICRFLFIFFTEFKRDRINLRAAALTYSVVLSLVPMLALSTAILKGMGAGDQMQQAAYQLIENLSGSARTIPDQVLPATKSADRVAKKTEPYSTENSTKAVSPSLDNDTASPKKDFSGYLYEAVDKIFAYVDRTNFAALGIIGTFLLLITVLVVINGIEEALNAIWHVDKSRSLRRKFMNYMALILICPLTVNLGIGATTMLSTPAIAKYIDRLIPLLWVQGILFQLLPVIFLTITFVLIYYFLPNLKVKGSAAWLGGLFAAGVLISLQKIFIFLQIGVANYNAIYGSFATVPLFLLWIHSAWLIFLLGAEASFTIQHYRNYHIQGRHLPPGPEMALTFDLIDEIYEHFDQRREATLKNLAAATNESTLAIEKLLKRLAEANLIRIGDSHPPTYLPTAPADRFKPAEITALLWAAEEEKPETLGHKLAATFFTAGNHALPNPPWREKS